MIDIHFSPYAGLLSYTYEFYNVTGLPVAGTTKHTLDCWLDFEDGDASVGLAESWSVFYAYLGGVDISDLLSEEVKAEIIEQAQLAYQALAEENFYD
jgi:hypothetical protein